MEILLQAKGTTAPVTLEEDETRLASIWHVIVLNDPVNLMSYVVMVFRKVFSYSLEKARKHMLEVHHGGRSRVWSGDREKGEHYVHILQQWHLTAILEQDDQN